MKKIKKPNGEVIEDRRVNGDMKLKDWLTPTTISLLVAGAITISGYKFTIGATADQVKVTTPKVDCLEKKMVAVETELPIIKENIKEIKEGQKIIQEDIKLVLREVAKRNGGN